MSVRTLYPKQLSVFSLTGSRSCTSCVSKHPLPNTITVRHYTLSLAMQQLKSSHDHKADLEASSDNLRQRLAREVGRCRDLTSDLNRTRAELVSAQGELAAAEEAKGALESHNQQLQVKCAHAVIEHFPLS